MDGYVKLIVGCVVLVPCIALAVLSAWKYWHGQWLRSITGWTFAPDEPPDSPYCKRRGKRVALFNLVLAAVLAGMLGGSAFSAIGGVPVNTLLWAAAAIAVLAGGGIWIAAASRSDARAVASEGPGLSEEYRLEARRVAVLAAVILAVLVVETCGSLVFPA